MNIYVYGKHNELHFLRPIMHELVGHSFHVTNDINTLDDAIDWSDLILIEWCDELATVISNDNRPRNGVKTVVRIHFSEVYDGRIHKVNWGNIDAIWFISEQVRKDFENELPNVNTPRFVIPNYVNEKGYPFKPDTDSKKLAAYSINHMKRKGYANMIRMFKLVHNADPEFTLHIRASPNPVEDFEETMSVAEDLGIRKNVFFEDNNIDLAKLNDKGDVIEFLKDKGYILSCSLGEAAQLSMAEGILSGKYPALLEWEYGSAQEFYSGFTYPTIDGVAESIIQFSRLDIESQLKILEKNRQHMIDVNGVDSVITALARELEGVLNR